jgi:hypothetical protein
MYFACISGSSAAKARSSKLLRSLVVKFSASSFESTQSPAALLNAFSAQMRVQGWQRVDGIATTLSGTATFECKSGTRALTATITVSRASAGSHAYVASMTV